MALGTRKGFLIAAAIILVAGTLSGVAWLTFIGAGASLAAMFWPSNRRSLQEAARRASAAPAPLTSPAILLDAVQLPLIVLDGRGIITRVNAAARLAFPGCRIGVPVSAGFRAPDVLAAIDDVLGGRNGRTVDFVERVPLERSFTLSISRLPDATARSAEVALVQAIETTELRRIEAMRVDFVANASHELRTPLASILGFVETLEGPAREDEKARTRFLAIMRQQAERMARLVEDLLSLSRIEMKAHIAPTDHVDLALLVPQVVDGLSGIARERGVAISIRSPKDDPFRAVGDRDELLRVFENLIENGIKYGQSGKRVEITLSHDEVSEMVRVAVRDFGPGIAARDLPRLTERFYRADVQESRIQGGTGLGLALVKHIVTRHRGRLLIESIEGQGATFIVLLHRPK